MKRLNIRKFIGVSLSIGFMSLIMTHFQNCAPASMQSQSTIGSGGDPMMRIVDDWNENKLLFASSIVSVKENDQNVVLHGVCDRSAAGEDYEWSISDDQQVKLFGASTCEGGGFRVVVNQLNDLECGVDYSVIVNNHSGQEDKMLLQKPCSVN